MSTQKSNQKYSIVQRNVCSALITLIALQPLQVTLAAPTASAPTPASAGLLELFDQPHLAGESIPPYVMITASKDQQLFKKAYDDYSDLDADGSLDTTYKHSIDYYGYFDSYKCYNYSDANRRFEPASVNTSKYCTGNWSGNFLNWASMTRADALRKVLFGGMRSPTRSGTGGDADGINDGDAVDSTVLERTYLPYDAHAFTKYYDGSDLDQLTPFNANLQTVKGYSVANGSKVTENGINTNAHRVRVGNTIPFEVGDIAELRVDANSYIRGRISSMGKTNTTNQWIELNEITATNISGNASSGGEWKVQNISRHGLTICNTTDGSNSGIQGLSNTNTNLPRMKVARGNFSLWNASERWQCTWSEERGASNGNSFAASGIPAYPDSPSRATWGLDETGKGANSGKGSYFVRSLVCVDGLLGKERCKQYPNGKFKPVGLIQVFGETDRIRFGLMTGSYRKNLSGGVLRKNVGRIDNEINLFTGTFYDLPAAGVAGYASAGDPSFNFEGGSIIKTLSLIRMTGYEYNSGTYFEGSSGDNCSYQRELNQNGACMSWGNPISEMYYEVLRYFGGQTTSTPAFNSSTAEPIDGIVNATWPTSNGAVLSRRNYCAPLNALVINAATNTNEKNTAEEGTSPSLGFMTGSPGTPAQLTDTLGSHLGLSGNYYIGARAGDAATSAGYNSCSGKSFTGLGNVYGVCPEGPTYGGSYHISGLALHAHTNQIRASVPDMSAGGAAWSPSASALKLKRPPLKMDTYAVSLSAGVPRVPIKFSADTEPRATLQPSYRLVGSTIMGGALVDTRVLFQKEEANRSTGRIFVSFEDSEGGGDYDMDVWGVMTYDLERTNSGVITLAVTTDAVYQATANPQGFGYIIAGTDRDGQHFHSGILGFTYTDATPGMTVAGDTGRINSTGGCNSCQVNDGPSTATYSLSTSPLAKSLEEPLYYAALGGGFEDSNKNSKPDTVPASGSTPSRPEWDRRNNSTGADTPDGIPDNYFKVSNPLGLEVGLERTFQLISEQTSLSAVSSSSTRVKAGSRIYEAKFNSGDWSGELESRVTDANGRLGPIEWTASSGLATGSVDPDARKIVTVTSDSKVGIPFRWANITAVQQALLDKLPSGLVDARGEQRLNYVRGSGANEGLASGDFRARLQTKLGDIVDSNPVYVGRPSAGFVDVSYVAFTKIARSPMIYVGANDGMLHAFDAITGAEKIAFVPSQAFRNLSELTKQDYSHKFFVNGQLTQQDVKLNGSWKTYLVGALGRGGQGVFGLDITNPATFSESNAANFVKWEFTDKDDPELGYVYSEPVIRKMPNGKWAALVSAGYNSTEPDGAASTTGKAHLFVLFLEGPTGANKSWVEGSDYIKIPIGASDITSPNGLGGVGTWDVEGDGTIDYAYAGDLKGTLWRIKFAGATPTGWTNVSNIHAFFEAQSGGVNQAITAAPLVSSGPNYTGALITFGTGKLLEKKDILPASTSPAFTPNTMYGVLDRFLTSPATIPISKLVKQVIIDSETADGTRFSLLTSYIPNYTSSDRPNPRFGANPWATGPTSISPPELGWRFDMPSSSTTGERSIFSPVQSGSLVVYSNAIPSAIPCDGGGSEARYALDLYTGGRARNGGFDRNSDDAINSADMSSFSVTNPGGVSVTKFYSSRRESTGGYGQVTILGQGSNNGGASGGSPSGTASSCNRALAYSSVGDQPDRLPGGCAARIQWRETLTN